jgi:hypothetical protein
MAQVPVAGAAAVTLGVLLAPHPLAGDIRLVAITAAAVDAQRFGARGSVLGMAAAFQGAPLCGAACCGRFCRQGPRSCTAEDARRVTVEGGA